MTSIIAIFLILTCTFIWGGVSIHYFIDYQGTLARNTLLKGKVQYFVEEMASIKKKMKNVEVIDQQLRELLYLNPDGVISQSQGSGGPSVSDMMQVAAILKENHDPITRQFKRDIDRVDEAIRRREESFDEIDGFLKRQREIWQFTPSIWPTSGSISSGYGYRDLGEGREFHQGVDIQNRTGTPVRATADGKVILAQRSGGYGLLVVIDHDNGFQTRYGHLHRMLVEKGDNVKKGEIIGHMGATGKTTGTHLHYEVRMLSKSIDPLKYM
jgi:hypothetical protein